MSYISPESTIYICHNVPFTANYSDTMTFNDYTAQKDFLFSKIKFRLDNYSYLRKSNSIKVEINIDLLYDCNYLVYKNTAFENKWFYAFITNVEYINNQVSEITFDIDVIQTWLFEYRVMPSYVEREHVESDAIGEHLIGEGLETGDYIFNGASANMLFTDWSIGLALIRLPSGTVVPGELQSGYYTGVQYLYFSLGQIDELNDIIKGYSDIGQMESVIAMFMIPTEFINMASPKEYVISFNRSNIDGYTPRNNKLLSSPYIQLSLDNFNGGRVKYTPEDLNQSGNTATFRLISSVSLESTCIMFPLGYKGGLSDLTAPAYGLTLKGFPQCTWIRDVYANWLRRNESNLKYDREQSILSGISGLASGNVMGGINSLGRAHHSYIEQQVKELTTPNDLGGQTHNDVLSVQWGMVGYTLSQYSIRAEFARKIDSVFDMFGYRIEAVKEPNINSRPCWNYIKTQNAIVTGLAPASALNSISKIYDAGITFWHGDFVGDYNLDNSIGSPVPDPPTPPPPPPPEGDESMIMPVPAPYIVTSEFGYRDYPPDPYHTGIDFACPTGTECRAALSGTITGIYNQSTGYGVRVEITSGNGILMRYGHLLSYSVTMGQRVTQGDVVALTDSTGLSTGPHLHFEVQVNGNPINPRSYLPNF